MRARAVLLLAAVVSTPAAAEDRRDDVHPGVLLQASVGYALARHVALTARVTNLFDVEYSTFGLLGEADEVLGDDYADPRFLSPGAPRAAWVGLQFSFR